MKKWLKRRRDHAVARARRFLNFPPNYIGDNGCLRAAASFVAWNQVEGDYLEFGVWRGYSCVTAYHHILRERESHLAKGFGGNEYDRWKKSRPRFFAFDSFSGLPDTEGAERMVDYSPGAYGCTRDEFVENVVNQGVKEEDLVIVEGLYDQTCVQQTKEAHELSRAAVVMIDCDLYESTVPVLDFLTDIVDQGSIIVFDDWFRFKGSPNSGEQRACREWLEKNPNIHLEEFWRQGPNAVSFLVNRS